MELWKLCGYFSWLRWRRVFFLKKEFKMLWHMFRKYIQGCLQFSHVALHNYVLNYAIGWMR